MAEGNALSVPSFPLPRLTRFALFDEVDTHGRLRADRDGEPVERGGDESGREPHGDDERERAAHGGPGEVGGGHAASSRVKVTNTARRSDTSVRASVSRTWYMPPGSVAA